MSLRVQKVSELIRRELSVILEKDYRSENCLVTIHEVSPTPDMRQCFVYVGVIGKPHQQENAIEKLVKARGSREVTLQSAALLPPRQVRRAWCSAP